MPWRIRLNIFNSTYTLADETSATDTDFQNIEGVIGHEYFHNWTGNRVTCRDWFQLTLKEGLTVYRDQEFSADMLSRAVKRLEDVRGLKNNQFTEDAGPLAHPIRPSKFVEINNFYTQTIYEKGAEVIRMIETLIGKEKFRKGMDKYFELNDGKAVTTEDFIHAMETASGKELTQFKNWYSRAGTPTIKVDARREGEELVLDISQSYPLTAWKVPDENVLQMPFKIGFLEGKSQREVMLELTKMDETFRFKMKEMPILSLNRGFSAPVHVDYKYDFLNFFILWPLMKIHTAVMSTKKFTIQSIKRNSLTSRRLENSKMVFEKTSRVRLISFLTKIKLIFPLSLTFWIYPQKMDCLRKWKSQILMPFTRFILT